MGASEQGADAISGRWLTIPRTLCFVCNGDDVLLMKRSPGRRVFPYHYNGVGGHIERDEDPYQCVLREVKEETGLTVRDVCLRAVYNIDAGQATGIILFVFTALSHSREIVSDSKEGTLHWIPRSKIMELDLVEDLPQLLPRIFERQAGAEPLFVHVSYDKLDRIVMRFAPE